MKMTCCPWQAVSAEDLAKRRDELAKMRSLLFRHEEKAKHMSKIKSKDYHRRMKKSARLKARLLISLKPIEAIFGRPSAMQTHQCDK